MNFETREAWLKEACNKLPEGLAVAGLVFPTALPSDLKVSCGFPSTRALSTKKRRIGECWRSGEPNTQVYISPVLDTPLDVLGTLVHELLHATLPKGTGHKGLFKREMKNVGLEGKPTETTIGEALSHCLNDLAGELGVYPHKAITASELERKKQTTRLRLYECACPVKVRVASDEFDATCNVCQSKFEGK